MSVLSRRAWLAGVITGVGAVRGHRLLACVQSGAGDAIDAEEITAIQASAAKVGLKFVSKSQTKHFLCMGDAPQVHCQEALKNCEPLAEAFLAHFRTRGFHVELPRRRMSVIALKDNASYKAYYGEDPGESTGGHFDKDTNRLVVFDFRPEGQGLAVNAARVNLLTLVHETVHQLTYNTGILDRAADVPAAISEGFATYAELWRPRGKGGMGAKNAPRLQALTMSRQAGEPWIPLAQLVADDSLFDDRSTEQRANSEAWLLVHFLLRTETRLPRFRAYLAGLQKDGGKTPRLPLIEKSLGSLETLDADVRKYAEKQLR
jgi:hypothetical protein